MAFDVIFSVRDGCGDHKNNFLKAFARNFSVILTNLNFVSFLAYDVTLRHSYPVTILFSDRCDAIFGKSISCSLLKTQQVKNTYKGLWEINKRVKIWCSVRSYPGCPKLPRLTVFCHWPVCVLAPRVPANESLIFNLIFPISTNITTTFPVKIAKRYLMNEEKHS